MIRFVWALLLVLAMCACRSTKVVTTTERHSDSTFVSQRWLDSIVRAYEQKDSVYIYDSVLITKGDTTVIEKYRYRDRWRIRSDTVIIRQVVHDSVFIASADTIPEVIEVEKELSTWESARMEVGGIAMWLMGMAAVAGAVWAVRRFKSQ